MCRYEKGSGFLFLSADEGHTGIDGLLYLQEAVSGPRDSLCVDSPICTASLCKLRCQVNNAGGNDQLGENRVRLASATKDMGGDGVGGLGDEIFEVVGDGGKLGGGGTRRRRRTR